MREKISLKLTGGCPTLNWLVLVYHTAAVSSGYHLEALAIVVPCWMNKKWILVDYS